MEITNRTYSEVYAILNLLSFEKISKIPQDIWKNIQEKRDKEVEIKIDNIECYTPTEEANYILGSLYKEYFATTEEKEEIKAKEKAFYEKQQEELHKKYNPDNIFKNKSNESVGTSKEGAEIIKYKEHKWYQKLFNKILRIFKK